MVIHVLAIQEERTEQVEVPVIAILATTIPEGTDVKKIYRKPEVDSFDKENLSRYILAAACSNGYTCGCNSGSNNMGSGSTCNCHTGTSNTEGGS
jgi:hypothetical protein